MPDTIALAAIALAIAVTLFGLVAWRRSRSRSTGRPAAFRGADHMRFTCAGCSGQFAHTKRTVAAWEKGSRRIFCDACHRKWLDARPPRLPSARADAVIPSYARSGRNRTDRVPGAIRTSPEARASGGCLGVAILMILVPVAVSTWVANA